MDSFHFVMKVENGVIPLLEGIDGVDAEGDALRSGRWQAAFHTNVVVPKTVTIRGVGGQVYVTDSFTGSWKRYVTEADPAAFFDKDIGAKALFESVRSPARLADSIVDGQRAYHLLGRAKAEWVAFITGVVEPDEEVWIEMWLTEADDYLVKVRLIGPVAPQDSADIVRTVTLSDFNQDVKIETPDLGK